MTRTRQQIIDELEQREQAKSNTTRQTCITSWLVQAKMWLDYTATDFEHALADAYRANQITPSKAGGQPAEQARQDTLALIGELKLFLAEEADEAGPAEHTRYLAKTYIASTAEANTMHYTCYGCGRTWKHTYKMETEGDTIFLSQFVATGAPRSDKRCTCGRNAAGELEIPLGKYKYVHVKLLAIVREAPRYSSAEQEQQYEALVDFLIDQEMAFISWDRLEEIEAKAAKIVDRNVTLAEWKAFSAEQQASMLKRQP